MPIACLIADDAHYDGIRTLLRSEGWDCTRFTTETALMRGLRQHRTDLVVVDAGADARMEERLLSWVRHRTEERTPVIMMSSNAAAHRIARALDAGVDDFVLRSTDPLELMARFRCAANRNLRVGQAEKLDILGYLLDRRAGQVKDRGSKVTLTAREFTMAWLFFSSAGKTLSRETISLAVWGVDADITHRTMEQHVYKLRKKLGLGGDRGVVIRALYSKGYRLEVIGEPEAEPIPPVFAESAIRLGTADFRTPPWPYGIGVRAA